ncbi:ABC transporter permease [Natronoglycomyces albus]|uniref:ABC transporter permease n=1 Tax=Natronoglycomyces albus TaxID=2811108 RepID=A0A895XT23_9ACTN|nr:ABC transporter permease [Natronoglycomyces albus]QSB06802.1 ABC transporter permease [Natronoglycomyces albus]
MIRTTIAVEARKALYSTVLTTTTALLTLGITALAVVMALGARAGNEQVVAQLGPMGELEGWPLLMGIVFQIAAAAVLLGFGTALSWIFGREFMDGTISGLFALPASLQAIAFAKLVVFLLWSALIALLVTAAILVAGLALGLGFPGLFDLAALSRLFVLVIGSGLLAIPAAWAATLGRGLLPGIAVSVILVASAQFAVVAGSGAWYPIAAPTFWAMDPAAVTGWQLGLVPAVGLVFTLATVWTWRGLQLDR